MSPNILDYVQFVVYLSVETIASQTVLACVGSVGLWTAMNSVCTHFLPTYNIW